MKEGMQIMDYEIKGDDSMIKYINTLEDITTKNLEGFFVDWPNPPSVTKHYELLEKSSYIWLAVENETGNVVGFITAISDEVLSAYIPLLEVLPEYQGRGIGKRLIEKMLSTLGDLYMIDLLCDQDMQEYYEKFKMVRSQGMVFRNYQNQSGR